MGRLFGLCRCTYGDIVFAALCDANGIFSFYAFPLAALGVRFVLVDFAWNRCGERFSAAAGAPLSPGWSAFTGEQINRNFFYLLASLVRTSFTVSQWCGHVDVLVMNHGRLSALHFKQNMILFPIITPGLRRFRPEKGGGLCPDHPR